VVYVNDDQSETFESYPRLLSGAEQLYRGLQGAGLATGDRVIFQLDNNQDFLHAFWACMLGGFVPCPLGLSPTLNNRAAGKLHNTWQHLGRPVILCANQSLGYVREHFPAATEPRVLTVGDLKRHDDDPVVPPRDTQELALLMLTSGSTGMPKAVMLTHRNIIARSRGSARMNDLSVRDVSLNWMPLDHVAGLILLHLRDVLLACQQILVPTRFVLAEPLRWLDLIEQHRITITFAPNFAYGLINDCAEALSRRRRDLSSIRFFLNGGEVIVPKTARRFLNLLSRHGLATTSMRPVWGMSETSSGVTYSSRFALDTTSDDDCFVDVGGPIPGVSLRIVDSDNKIVAEGIEGSLQVTGAPVTAGYYGTDPDPNVSTSDGWLQTGDRGFLRAGHLTITGREKDVIIINGVNYHSHEIESVVEQVDGVEGSFTAACAVRKPDDHSDRLAIFFHPATGHVRIVDDLLSDISRAVVAQIGICPAFLVPVEKQDIPKTSIGKIQRSALSKRFQDGGFSSCVKLGDRITTAYVAPRTSVEQEVNDIWEEVLKRERFGIHDKFFDLGGDSLAAMRIVSGVIKQFQLEIPLRHLFASPTVAEMTAVIEAHRFKPITDRELDQILSEVEALTDNEAQTLLGKETGGG
jgi:acyl-CoA synthetase (AMP-forming)/AMP-acid ligase II/acyl carrier protein